MKRKCIDCGKLTDRYKRCTRCAKIHNKKHTLELNKEWKKRNVEIDRRYQREYQRDLRAMNKYAKETNICFDSVASFRKLKEAINLSLRIASQATTPEDSGISRREEEFQEKRLQNISLCDTLLTEEQKKEVKNHA